MFKYKGCTGQKYGTFWQIRYEDGTYDGASSLKMALYLCESPMIRGHLIDPIYDQLVWLTV